MSTTLRQRVRTPEEVSKETSQALALYELKPNQKITVVDPITKKKSIVVLDRTGHSEAKLITALADPHLSRDRKDQELSMYLFTRGAEGASMILDLLRYKGEHTKETRVFKSQVRFDFEAFVDSMVQYLQGQADRAAAILGIDLKKEIEGYRRWLGLPNNKGKGYSYADYRYATGQTPTTEYSWFRLELLAISEAIFALDQAQRLEGARDNITKAREREKGGGIYVGKGGKVYSVSDPEVDAIIKADREATREIEKP